MTPQPIESIGDRLRSWGIKKYGSVKNFSESVGVSSVQMSQYLNGHRNPGNKMQERLRELGCDLEWLMTGESEQSKKEIDDDRIHFYAPRGIDEQTKDKYEKLLKLLSEVEPGRLDEVDKILRVFKKKK